MTWLTVIQDHELIEIGNRRWCVTCSLFQQRGANSGLWPVTNPCPRNTPYAQWLERKKKLEGDEYPIDEQTNK
jgi:hypothetical protein